MSEKAKKASEILRTKLWLKLRVLHLANGPRYEVGFYIASKNQNRYRVVGHHESQALEAWNTIVKNLPQLETFEERDAWLTQRIVAPTKRIKRKDGFNLELGESTLAKQLSAYCAKQVARPITRISKNRHLKVCRDILKLAGANEGLTPAVVKKFFKLRMRPDAHDSHDNLLKNKSIVMAVARYLEVKSPESLFKDIEFPTKSQMKTLKVSFKSKDRRHLERDDVKKFVAALLEAELDSTVAVRSALLIQLISGCRPSDAPNAEILPSSIRINVSKTQDSGVSEIIIAKTAILDALLTVSNCSLAPVDTKKAASAFKELAQKAFGKSGVGLDRYCLRHTALTWACKCWDLMRVRDMAGHTGARMLEDYYLKRPVRDQREWLEAMPIGIKSIPKDWHGFLLECALIAKWPELAHGVKPNGDKAFNTVIEILSSQKVARKEIELF